MLPPYRGHEDHRKYRTAFIPYPHSETVFLPVDVGGSVANNYSSYIRAEDRQVKGHEYYAPERLNRNEDRPNLFISARISTRARDEAFDSFNDYDDGVLHQVYHGHVHISLGHVAYDATWGQVDRALQGMQKPDSFLCRLVEPRVIPNGHYGQYATLRVADAGETGVGDVPEGGDRVVGLMESIFGKLHQAGIKVPERRPHYPHITIAKRRGNRTLSPPHGLPAWVQEQADFQSSVFHFVEFRLCQSVYSQFLGDHCLLPLQLIPLANANRFPLVPKNNPPNPQWYGAAQ